jgi:hypothetical protein
MPTGLARIRRHRSCQPLQRKGYAVSLVAGVDTTTAPGQWTGPGDGVPSGAPPGPGGTR